VVSIAQGQLRTIFGNIYEYAAPASTWSPQGMGNHNVILNICW